MLFTLILAGLGYDLSTMTEPALTPRRKTVASATGPKPILKWAGGKRQLLPAITAALPEDDFDRYYEPFLGGGAVLFHLEPERATVNDVNSELINLYVTVRDDVDGIISLLSSYPNDAEFFSHIRSLDREPQKFAALSAVERAARTVYLNRTCFNGLFRVNNAGQFNAPFGRYANPTICDEPTLRAVSDYFNTADISFLHGDYKKAVAEATNADFVYFDPPYDPVNATSSFTGYAAGGFGRTEQIELKKLCDKLHSRGVRFMLSNSATPFITDLYADYDVSIVPATRAINSVGSKRGKVDEVLVSNY